MKVTFYATIAVAAMNAALADAKDVTAKDYLMLAQSYQDFDLGVSETLYSQIGDSEQIEALAQISSGGHTLHKPKPMGQA